MKTVTASAPGKIILLGEHAVVYGQPALAIPVLGAQATAEIRQGRAGSRLIINARDLNSQYLYAALPAEHPLATATRLALSRFAVPEPDATITIKSTIPIAGGMGSGAAVSAAVVKALALWFGVPLENSELSQLVYEVEKLHHGTPSGIDNTIICMGKPVFYIKGTTPITFMINKAFDLLIADTGIHSPTKLAVAAVRELWEGDKAHYDALFAEIGKLAHDARGVLEVGTTDLLGTLMNRNQELLRQIAVSSPELETLIGAALDAGAGGAKLSGGGRGGNMIAFVSSDDIEHVTKALYQAGAKQVLHTQAR